MLEAGKRLTVGRSGDGAAVVELRRLREDLRREAERDRRVSWIDRIVASVSFTLSWAGILGAYVLVFEERGASVQRLQGFAALTVVVVVLLTVIPLALIRAEERRGTAGVSEADVHVLDDEVSLGDEPTASRVPQPR